MIAALLIVLPIFALITVGWAAGRQGILGATASAEINKFVVWLAVPALLFDVISEANISELSQFKFIAAFGLSTSIVFVIAVAVGAQARRNLADAAIDGLNAAYSNIGFVGLPLMLLVLGKESVIFTTLALLITMCLIFATTIVLVELGLHKEGGPGKIVSMVSGTLVRNPILISSAAALPFACFGWSFPTPIKTFLELLGGAASPCALVALGLFLSQPRPERGQQQIFVTLLVLGKLVVHPMLAWTIGSYVFNLSTYETVAITLLAALPAGTGSFMLAGYYGREPAVTTIVIIASTIVSVFTLSALVAALPGSHL